MGLTGGLETCRPCGAPAQASKDLARRLRAISLNRPGGERLLSSYLSVADERTLDRLFERAGLARDARIVPLRTFFMTQRLVPLSTPCLQELAHVAANSRLFF